MHQMHQFCTNFRRIIRHDALPPAFSVRRVLAFFISGKHFATYQSIMKATIVLLGKEEKKMSMYRCAVCGSPHVRKEENNNGFSYKKALVGTAVFGAVGAVAGINGKTTVAFTCSDCGSVMPEPMDKYTLDLIEIAFSTPRILSDSLKKLVDKYPYISKEFNEKLLAADPHLKKSATVGYGGATVSEEEFITAVKQAKCLYDFKTERALREIVKGNAGWSVLREKGISFDQIKNAIQALPTVYKNIQHYPNYILRQNGDSEFTRRGELTKAITYHILLENGKMTLSGLFEYVQGDNQANHAYDVLFGDKVRHSYSVERGFGSIRTIKDEEYWYKFFWLDKFCLHLGSSDYVWSTEHLGPNNGQVMVSVPFMLRDGLLYARNPQSEKDFTEQVTQKREEAIPATLKQEMYNNRLQAAGIKIPTQLPVTAAEDGIQRDILRIGREIAEHQETIEKLGKKIFGKKKAMAEIDRLNAIIQECNNRTKRLKEEAASLENERNCRLDDLQQKARKQQRELDDAYAALTAQKEEYLRQFDEDNATHYDEWICLEK